MKLSEVEFVGRYRLLKKQQRGWNESHLNEQLRLRLLGSIAGHRLTLLVGAGLSMSAPSNLPSAWTVAEKCFDLYVARIGPMPPEYRHNLEAIANHIIRTNDFRNIFINILVPWRDFVAPPNEGHAAIADFLLTGAVPACLTSNYDMLIETVGQAWGADLQTALSGEQATEISAVQSPLLKFHGCMTKDRDRTLWTNIQFENDNVLAQRRDSAVHWMVANLQRKDLLIIGFWSDWAYLNAALEQAISRLNPLSITIVDPSNLEVLQEKAPTLWALAHQDHVTFEHVNEQSHVFLQELRAEVSKAFFRELFQIGAVAFTKLREAAPVADRLFPPNLSNDGLYTWRRDAEGCNARQPCRRCVPDPTYEAVALAHVLLRNVGAVSEDSWYRWNNQRVRVVNGAGRLLQAARAMFSVGPAAVEADIVICAGATDLAVPDNIIRGNQAATMVRPAPTGRWITLDTAIEELQL